MISKDLKKVQRVLKKNNISPEDVADAWVVSTTHVSKVFNGHRPLTKENQRVFNDKFGHIIMIDPSLVQEEITVNDLNKTVQDLTAIVFGLKEFVVQRVVVVDKTLRAKVLSDMGILEEEVRKQVKSGGIPND